MSDIFNGGSITDDDFDIDVDNILKNLPDDDADSNEEFDVLKKEPEDEEEYIPAIERLSVRASRNLMEAYIVMPRTYIEDEKWILDTKEVINFLSEEGVVFGVDPIAVRKICKDPVFGTDVLVARGEPPEEGTPGKYEYFFETKLSNKPVIKEDGTVDFKAIKCVETVKKDDVVAVYHPAVQGKPGTNVFGYDIASKPVKDLSPIAGTGFSVSEDGLTYTADMSGKIELKDKRILITPVFEVSFDVGTDIGNVDFQGDVIIHGTVTNGAYIKAAGSVTVDEVVDNCSIYSKKDIVLKSGVKGNENTIIKAGGSITTEFVEFADVFSGGDIIADVLFNSNVECDATIHMMGDHANIIGGNVKSIEGIECYSIGNTFGVRTFVLAGIDQEKLERMKLLATEIENLQKEVDQVTEGLLKFERMAEERGLNFKDDPRRVQLLRGKIRHEATIGEKQMELTYLEKLRERAKKAYIKVVDRVFGGVDIFMDEFEKKIIDVEKQVEFKKGVNEIKMEKIV